LYPMLCNHALEQRIKRGLRHPKYLEGNRRVLNIKRQSRKGSPPCYAVEAHAVKDSVGGDRATILYVYDKTLPDSVEYLWEFDRLQQHFKKRSGTAAPIFISAEWSQDADNSLQSHGISHRPALYFFPCECMKSIEYRSILIIGQLEPAIKWISRRLDGSVDAEWLLAFVSPLLSTAYPWDAGYSIESDEEEAISKTSGDESSWWRQAVVMVTQCSQNAAVYGELEIDGVHTLVSLLGLKSEDIFWDLGCGVGKALLQVALETDAKCMGVELSSTRVDYGIAALKKFDQLPFPHLTDEEKRNTLQDFHLHSCIGLF